MRAERGLATVAVIAVVVILALFAGLLLLVPHHPGCPTFTLQCQNHLREIGSLLVLRQKALRLRTVDGAAFLLQVAEEVTDDNLGIFLCPGEVRPLGRPAPGTLEFVDLYRRQLPKGGLDDRMCSYAGPDRTAAGVPGAIHLWAGDRCRDGKAHHQEGVVVLYADSAKVDVIEAAPVVGAASPHPLLRTVTFYPAPDR